MYRFYRIRLLLLPQGLLLPPQAQHSPWKHVQPAYEVFLSNQDRDLHMGDLPIHPALGVCRIDCHISSTTFEHGQQCHRRSERTFHK